MATSALTGTRLRERRLSLGMRQAELARAAGVSASYLNLIEHNRRRVGGEVLVRLAAALGLGAEALAGAAGDRLVEALRAAAALAEGGGVGGVAPEIARAEDFAGRFPGWAGLVAAQHLRLEQLDRAVGALNDRMTHDPHLGESLHEVLSAVSSVRSTAAILAETEDIDPEWRLRFHRNLHRDSERLALGAEALVAYLDGSGEAEEQGIAAPQEEVEAWLAARGWHLEELEAEGPAALEAEVAGLASAAARALARALALRVAADAAAMPRAAFARAVAEEGGDSLRLAARFGVPVTSVFRRIALTPASPAGLLSCDASGTLVFRKPPEGFDLPRFGAACPLWPLYAALARPMSPVAALIETAGPSPRRYRVQAFSVPSFPAGMGGAELREAGMLMLPSPQLPGPGEPVLPVGTTCRICPRPACAARREPSILSEGAG